jgi:glycerol-3-phosphate dehydrogenase (NAD(P)+)
MSLGMGLGQGRSARDLLAERRTVAEGAHTAPVLLAAARALGVDMPITEAVVALLAGEATVDAVLERLLSRPRRAEHE